VQGCPNEAISITVVDGTVSGATTQYVSTKPMLAEPIAPRASHHSHPALAVMLVLTQLSVGAFVAELVRGHTSALDSSLIAAVGLLAMGASVFHLGRPLYAYRALLGLRTSWLSREILAFGAFMPLAMAYAVMPLPAIGAAAAVVGVLGVWCSVLIYATTPRWSLPHVFARFFGGAALAGVVTVWSISSPWTVCAVPVLVAAQLYERNRFFTR
jgi:DMSO reductase anchor subunit